ncbi:unknown [Erysipelothrix amsterdamensis]|uniref:Uncharacterized protein n=1 Tax=Erysipelothrix amsterdamensis TaxID=2929157 RepID=A0AAU9VMV2_9FIRM|nr:hypothetical protein [Erysipelothrix rhusiopathiae]CAH2763357.1 unknown [Erysipelothrix sp. A18Y020d]CAH2763400.1 unknown [Erysipelothrix sp. A18Y020d]
MKENKKGYYIYSIFAVIFGFGLIAYICYLFYDLVLKLSDKDFSENTVIQALITLIITVFIGGYFSKFLEHRNMKKNELYKIRTTISLNLIDYSSAYYWKQEEDIRRLLINESNKVKLYFDDVVLEALNDFLQSDDKDRGQLYELFINALRDNID